MLILARLGHYLSQNLAAEGAVKALKFAIGSSEAERYGLIHHSDRGVQYCCKEYVELLKTNEIRISMTENGDPYENAMAERVNGILKGEWLNEEKFYTFDQAKIRIDEVISIYNTMRPHLSCSMKTPQQVHIAAKNYYKNKQGKPYPVITKNEISTINY